tara:strand:+ start:90 stop:623 length:534 start_codon:yes stop_codon:yes gene_type:complete
MSTIKLKGSSSGELTISAPAAAGTNTISLPAETGNLLTSVTTGTILQVVQAEIATTQNTTSTSYTTSNLEATITPASTSNKVLIILSGGNCHHSTNGANVLMAFHRGGSVIGTGPHAIIQNTSGTNTFKSSWSASYLDSPSSTSELTYAPFYKVSTGTGHFNEATVRVNLTLFEVAG